MKTNYQKVDDIVHLRIAKKSVSADFDYVIDKFGPAVSLCYIVLHVYSFAVLLNFWNGFDALTIAFSAMHLSVPLYTIAFSSYQAPAAQFIIYYFSSTVTTIASILLAVEAAMLGLGLLA